LPTLGWLKPPQIIAKRRVPARTAHQKVELCAARSSDDGVAGLEAVFTPTAVQARAEITRVIAPPLRCQKPAMRDGGRTTCHPRTRPSLPRAPAPRGGRGASEPVIVMG